MILERLNGGTVPSDKTHQFLTGAVPSLVETMKYDFTTRNRDNSSPSGRDPANPFLLKPDPLFSSALYRNNFPRPVFRAKAGKGRRGRPRKHAPKADMN